VSDLNAHALRLLRFVEDSVTEAIATPAERVPLLEEAQGALRVLCRTLFREDQAKLAQTMLASGFHWNLPRIGAEEGDEKLGEALETILSARVVFEG
jgi:hypothetical protein